MKLEQQVYSLELAERPQVIGSEAGAVTAGNAPSVNDGSAAAVLMELHAAEERGLKPIAKLIDYAVAGVEPGVMGIGPVSAVRKSTSAPGWSS